MDTSAIPKVSVSFYLYSKAGREGHYGFSDKEPYVTQHIPDGFKEKTSVFDTLPWNESRNWRQFLDFVYAKIRPLTEVPMSKFSLFTFPHQPSPYWYIEFYDGYNGRKYKYRWNGGKINDQNVIKEN